MTMTELAHLMDPRNPDLIRDDIRESLIAYAQEGRTVGGFLEAVIANDLVEAAGRADIDNLRALAALACFVYNELPSPCWGSRRVYAAWVAWHRAKRDGTPEEADAARAEVRAAGEESRARR